MEMGGWGWGWGWGEKGRVWMGKIKFEDYVLFVLQAYVCFVVCECVCVS